MKRLKGDNKGFTILELMVVVAILAIVLVIFVMNFSLLFSTDAKRCATKTQSALTSCRMNNMARKSLDGTYVALTMNDRDRLFATLVVNGTVRDSDQLSSYPVSVTWTNGGIENPLFGSDAHVNGANTLFIFFDRESGKLGGMRLFSLSFDEDGQPVMPHDSDGKPSNPCLSTFGTGTGGAAWGLRSNFTQNQEISFASGDRSYSVYIDYLTGKVSTQENQ